MTQFNLARTAAALTFGALMIAATVATAAAANEETSTHDQVELDRTSTGSIGNVENCDPTAPNASLICRITNGERNAKFPSAPSGPFGM